MSLTQDFYNLVWIKAKTNPFTAKLIHFLYELKLIWLKQGLRIHLKGQNYKNNKFIKILNSLDTWHITF